MRTTVTIDDDLLAQAKILAARTHRTVGSVLEDALRDLIARQADATGQPRLVLPVSGGGGLLPGVDLQDKELMAELMGDNRAPAGVATVEMTA